jgi:hypothetical protein
MALEKFSLASVASMDGSRIEKAFEHALNRCRFDCEDRPAVKGARKITLTVTLEPLVNDAGDLGSVNVAFDLADKLPKRSSKAYNMMPVVGGLAFNELSPEEARQMTLDMAPSPGGRKNNPKGNDKTEVSNAG